MTSNSHDSSPIGFNNSAFAADGEVDEANLFMQPDAPTMESAVAAVDSAMSQKALADALDELLSAAILGTNDDGDKVAQEQSDDATEAEVDVLDALLAEAMAPMQAKQQLAKNREKLARAGLTKTERDEIEAKIREWEAKLEWEPKANALLFIEQVCDSCNRRELFFSAVMQRQEHRTKANTRRWVTTRELPTRLPNETAIQAHHTPMCSWCCGSRGFDLGKAYRIDGSYNEGGA